MNFETTHIAVARQEEIGLDNAVGDGVSAGREIGLEYNGALLADGFENLSNVLADALVTVVEHQHMVVAQAANLLAQQAHRCRSVAQAFEHRGHCLNFVGAKMQVC